MNEDLHPDRLPWFVADRLDPQETRSIVEHLEGCAACRDEAAALDSMRKSLEATRGSGHVPSHDLVAFAEDDARLAGERRAAIARHLAECAECAEDARRVRGIAGPRRTASMRRVGLAAAMVGALAALGVFVVARRAVQPSPPAVTLFASPHRAPGTEMVLEPGPARPISVLLPLDAPAGNYRLRLERSDGGGETEAAPLAADENRVVSAMLPAITAPGSYSLVLRPEGSGTQEYRYPFRAASPSPR